MPATAPSHEDELESLLGFLEHQRQAVRNATYGLSDDQARLRPTPSALSLGGIVSHLAYVERTWTDRVDGVPPGAFDAAAVQAFQATFVLAEGATLAAALEDYRRAAERTDASVRGADGLGRHVALPARPWSPDPQSCTVRWVVLHLVEETARHAGHADIIREALDGASSTPLMAAAEGWPEEGWVKPWRPAG